jgi:hypothetical protein
MTTIEHDALKDAKLAKVFSKLGWSGFWLQLVIGAIPVGLLIYFFVFSPSTSGTRSGLPVIAYLTIANLLLLAFTLFWSYRYTLIAKRITDPSTRPSDKSIVGTVWTGINAGILGILCSMVLMFIESAQLLFYFLSAPQAGVPVIQTTGGGSASWVSAADIVSLMALILTLFAELLVLAFSLRLLFRSMQVLQASLEAGRD